MSGVRLVGYARVSRVGGRAGETFISPSVQRETVEAYARARGHEIAEWIEDLDQPGTRYERPGFQHALELVVRGEADGLAAARLDRFARSVVDGRRALQRLRDAGGSLVLVAEGLDTTTPIGKAMFTILLAFAELEVDRIREGWQTSRRRALERGVHAAKVPFGYRRNSGNGIEPDAMTAPIALEVFRRRAAGASWRELCDYLDRAAPRACGAWPLSTVSRMIERRTYIGEGEAGTRHEAIVPRQVWEAARDKSGSVPRFAPAPRLLTGLLRCASCGGTLSGTTKRSGRHYYRCRGRSAAGVCPDPARIGGGGADLHVEEVFLAWLGERASVDERADSAGETERLTTALQIAEQELASYLESALVGVVGEQMFRRGVQVRQEAVDRARRNLVQRSRNGDIALVWTRSLRDGWSDDLTIAEKRQILLAAIERVVVKPAHQRVHARAGRPQIPLGKRLKIVWRPVR
jgi:site-specific DNA recombinase